MKLLNPLNCLLVGLLLLGCSSPTQEASQSTRVGNVAGSPSSGPIRVACVGDSITEGYLLDSPQTEAYPALLQKQLGNGYLIRNFGSSGSTAIHGGASYRVRPQSQASLEFQPDIVVVMFGTNDTRPGHWTSQEDFIRQYSEIIQSYTSLPTHSKVLIGVPPRNYLHAGELSGAIRRIADSFDAEIVNLYKDVCDHLPDRLHPDAAGHRIMAKRVATAIRGL